MGQCCEISLPNVSTLSFEVVKHPNQGCIEETEITKIPVIIRIRLRVIILKVHKIENFFDSDFGICVISLLVMHK